MNTIVQQICERFIREVTAFFSEGSVRQLEEMEEVLKEKTDGFLLEMMRNYLETIDQAMVEDRRTRKRKGLIIERREDQRDIQTRFGLLHFARTYFYDKKRKAYAYLLDQAVGMEGYDRVSRVLAKELVEHAEEASYWESSRHVSGGAISRQTVMRKVHMVRGLRVAEPTEKKVVPVLHVEADEDHVAMQDGSNVMVPLISIHEGIERNGRRGQCKNIHHISSYGKTSEELWLEVVQWIDQAYEWEEIKRVYLHGDGASWIKEGRNWLPNVKMVLDRYHLNKALTMATGRQRERRNELYDALRTGDRQQLQGIVGQMVQNAETPQERERIQDFARYVRNNWEGIEINNLEVCGGSCAEGHVSHVLSSRLSSRPMAWGREGLTAMSELRAFCSNGGRLDVSHLRTNQKPVYKPGKQVMQKASKAFGKTAKEAINNIPVLRNVVNLTHVSLRGLQNGHWAF